MVEAGRAYASPLKIDLIVGLGGGSSMDCAKGINFVLTNGGTMRNYWGYGKATRPMLPMVAIPTTAGTGSEAQSYAVIFDMEARARMACGDPKACFRAAILDPKLTLSQPSTVTALTGFDALSHAVETLVSTRRTPLSECFSREAWRLLNESFERVIQHPDDLEARGQMMIGAHLAGLAVENSMLGAAHACANPLTESYRIAHGAAIAIVLPSVVEFNRAEAGNLYRDLDPENLGARLRRLAGMASLAASLRDFGVPKEALPRLAEEAGAQWTGRFNPRPLDAARALEIYTDVY